MVSKQEQRSEETKKSILASAGVLFSSRGYDAVTMRDIAKEAGCSHTTIYIYFKDKEALLHQLSMPPILQLLEQVDTLLSEDSPPSDKLQAISLQVIEFCLVNRNMYNLFFTVKSVRVDEQTPEMAINQARNKLFGKLTESIQAVLGLNSQDEQLLLYTRIYFFSLYGIIATYSNSDETVEQLMGRLQPTFAESFEVLLIGIRSKVK
ncbi:TetR/AcrR family transcriptional regulator [Paenibacillus alba]|uniref:TetR/AcrR family transcriptional regulator n=1 Tax=Paenibacillus alba TaxID=1197127 RepID=A0ABU6G5S7_9BACL|nr:TetR/AcrR family transcriptional regulator [Paenibacillus alba]MEC0229522.1 TetR/AcrR family transcriptional regulator [Paenibacillus alba]